MPHSTNHNNKYEINSVSNPFYVSDVNGNLGITIEVTTKNNRLYVFEGEGIVYFGKKYMDIFENC